MFVVGNTGDDVNEYTLTTGFDVSSASFVDRLEMEQVLVLTLKILLLGVLLLIMMEPRCLW